MEILWLYLMVGICLAFNYETDSPSKLVGIIAGWPVLIFMEWGNALMDGRARDFVRRYPVAPPPYRGHREEPHEPDTPYSGDPTKGH